MLNDSRQSSSTILLVRPSCFAFHPEAALSNAFALDQPDVAGSACEEFDVLVGKLVDAGIDCLVLDDEREPPKPDAVFPNNWVSFHGDGTLILYPMATKARRTERVVERLGPLLEQAGLRVHRTIDLSGLEANSHFLEGTGSLVLDRPNACAFASRSVRTHPEAIAAFERTTGWTVHQFDSADRSGQPLYHTNVLLSLGSRIAILCAEAIMPADRAPLVEAIANSGREIVEVSLDQMERFACNAIEVETRAGDRRMVMSSSARSSFRKDQVDRIEALCGAIIDAPVPVIERVGGGSVRCMIADVHLPAL